jgi:prepilin-type N-terminal cleavage/methylation domain-containing protein
MLHSIIPRRTTSQASRQAKPALHTGSLQPGRNGFTLIEMILVVTIMGIVAAFTLPKIDYAKYRVNSSMRGLGTTLLGAQRRAVSSQHDIIVTFDVTQQSIRILEDANNNGQADDGERTRGIPLGEHVVIGRASTPSYPPIGAGPVVFTRRMGGIPALTFHRNGSASEMGGVYLTSRRALNSSDILNDTRLVTIERATGRVSWFSHNATGWEQGF